MIIYLKYHIISIEQGRSQLKKFTNLQKFKSFGMKRYNALAETEKFKILFMLFNL